MQYNAQVDVIGQLEERVRTLLQQQKASASSSQKTALIKLERDFERVLQRAKQLQSTVVRQRKQAASKAKAAAAAAAAQNGSNANQTPADHYEQQQLQLQQDVSEQVAQNVP